MPSVSIGIPARNEARFIAQTLDSVLAQDFTDWELVVSDNASTDGTDQLVREYAARDPRIRLDRVTTTVSQVENFNRLARNVASPYFVWLGGHDRWAPDFLSRCVGLLGECPSAVLSFSDAIVIDADGKRRNIPWVMEAAGAPGPLPSLDTRFCQTPEARYLAFLFTGTNGTHVHGVIRTEALRRTSLMRPSLFPDAPLLGELALLGAFARVEGPPLFECRLPRLKSWRERVNTLKDDGPLTPAWAHALPSLHWATECVTRPFLCDVPGKTKAAAATGALMFALTSLRRMLVMELVHASQRGASRVLRRDMHDDGWMDVEAV